MLAFAAVIAIQCAGSDQSSRGPRARPVNVLLVTIDTLRADAIGASGNHIAQTPWIDRLAAGGVRFDRAHAHNVVTLPSHANILSGRYPIDHGVRDNAGFRFPAAIDTLATILHARGYRTGAFVSAFPLASRFGLARGFDVYDDRFVDATPRPAFLEQERRGGDTVAIATTWLQAQRSTPTFCWVHIYEPHFPYAPPEPFASRFANAPYAGEVAAADAALQPLLQPLIDRGAASRTIVVLTGDHGESLGEHGEATHGIFAYEATLRVPLIVWAPSLVSPRVESAPARHVDILPTILEAVGAPLPRGLRGRSLLPTTDRAGSLATDRTDHSATDHTDQSATDHTDIHGSDTVTYFEALSGALNRGWAPLTGVLRGDTKYIDLPVPELYDLSSDPGERENVVGMQPARRDGARAALASFQSTAPAIARSTESAENRERLRSLGYAGGSASPLPTHYTAADDPKRLIALDTELQEIVGRYLSGDARGALTRARAFAAANPRMAVAFLQLGHLERESGNLPAAVAAMRRALALKPGDAEITALTGAYLTEAGQPREAVAVLQPLASRPQPDVQVLIALGLAQARQDQPDAALATLGRARRQAPANAMLLVDIGTVNLMAGRHDEARRAFEAAIAERPELARAHSSLGAIHADAGRTDAAMAEWKTATSLDASEYGRLFALGVAHARNGRNAKARPYLQFFAASAPADRYAPQIAQARAWLSGGHR